MNLKHYRWLNWFVIFALMLFCSSLQTVLLDFKFEYFSPPLLWLIIPTYILIYRSPGPSIPFLYVLAIPLSTSTSLSLPMLWITMAGLAAAVILLKNRIFWEGPVYFAILCAYSCAVFHIVCLVSSYYLEKNFTSFDFFARLTQTILTPIVSLPVFFLLQKLDKATYRFQASESGGHHV